MHEVGGTCSQRGVWEVAEAAALKGKAGLALGAFANTGSVEWKPCVTRPHWLNSDDTCLEGCA